MKKIKKSLQLNKEVITRLESANIQGGLPLTVSCPPSGACQDVPYKESVNNICCTLNPSCVSNVVCDPSISSVPPPTIRACDTGGVVVVGPEKPAEYTGGGMVAVSW